MKNILKLGSSWFLAAIFSANFLAFGAVPLITGINPPSGSNGTPVTITGANFGTVPSNNIVYFGAVRATVATANQSNLLVTVPSGATYAPVTVTVGGLVAYSRQPFQPGFAGSSGISTSTFAPAVNVPTSAGPSRIAIGDLNGDGKPDFVVASIYANTISIYQNLGTDGPLGSNSFASPIIIPFGSGDNPYWITLADVDGDGRLDIVVPDQNNSAVTVFRNVSSGGALSATSFAAPVSFTVGSHPREVVVRDLDGDGRPDIAVANIGDDTISILKNIGTAGSIASNSFAAQIVLAAGSQPHTLAVGDLDRDGKPDFAVGNYTSPFVSLFRNVSVAGTLNSNSFASRVDLPANFNCNSIVLGDVDGDGRLDIVCGTAEGNSAVSVFHNVSNPGVINTNSFEARVDFASGGWVSSVALGDLDGDGRLDILSVTQIGSEFSVYPNLSVPGTFTSSSLGSRVDFPSGSNPYGVSVDDLDGDGRPDVLFANFYDGTLTFYQTAASVFNGPTITSQPTNQTVSAGGTASFSVTVTGSPTLHYQWWRGPATIIPGATSPTLTLSNVQPTDAGTYLVIVTNQFGFAMSSNAVLTVTGGGGGTNTCTPPASGLAAWWPAEGNGSDVVGGNTAIAQPGVSYAAGKVDQAFLLNISSNAYLTVAASSNMSVGAGGSLTIEAWIKLSDVTGYHPIAEWNDGVGHGGAHLWILPFNGLTGVLFANVVDTVGNSHSFNSPAGSVTSNVLEHVALTYDHASGLGTLYVNGIAVAQQNLGIFTPQTSYQFWMGHRPADVPGNATYGAYLGGLLDELSLYRRALSSTEIAAIYAADSFGKCSGTTSNTAPVIIKQPTNQSVSVGGTASFSVTATGSPTLHYQWYGPGTSLIAGAINPTLTLSNVQPSNAGSYFVLVTNLFGFAQSSNAVLTVTGGGGGTNTCTPPASGLAAWWPGEGNGNDIVNGNTAILESGVTFAAGKVGQAFQLQNPTNAFMHVPASPSLNVGAGSGLTIEGWINVSSVSGFHPIAEWYGDVRNNVGVQLWLNSNPSQSGALVGALPDTNLVPHTLVSPAGILIPNVFQHVAMTYDQASGIGTLYVNGAVVAQQNLGSFVPQTTYDLWIGHRPFDVPGDWTYGTYLGGMLDELSIYGRALSADEIATIYNAGSFGKCTVNHPPIADATATASLVISPNGSNATVVLDGSLSSDPDGDPLQYSWFEGNAPAQVASGVVAVVTLPIGTNSITLSVSDGANSNRQTIAVEVITTTEAVTRLMDLVDTNVTKAQALAAKLSAGIKSIDKSNPNAAINQLQAFQNQVLAQIAPLDPDLADSLISDAQEVIDALTGVVPKGNEKNAALIRNQNGKAQVQFAGAHGNTYIIEASSDMVHWEKIGVAREPSMGAFEFEDTTAPSKSRRFYRVVVP